MTQTCIEIQPAWDEGIPVCVDSDCCQYDGKRCRAIGFRPGRICEPAVRRLIEDLAEARKLARNAGCDVPSDDGGEEEEP